MGEHTAIEWTDHTFSPWWGCVEAPRHEGSRQTAPECARCYARTFAKRLGFGIWGKDAPRRFFGDVHWSEPLKWDRKAAAAGERRRVFCASMADVFEDRDGLALYRERLWELIEKTSNLDWLLLTKRPENMVAMAPDAWRDGWPRNAWAGTTVGHPDSLWRAGHLLGVPAPILFLSIEPLTAALDLTRAPLFKPPWPAPIGGEPWLDLLRGEGMRPSPLTGVLIETSTRRIDWVIVAGESGPGARPFDLAWARSIIAQCKAAGCAAFVKQLGAHPHETIKGRPVCRAPLSLKGDHCGDWSRGLVFRDRKGGACDEWPEDLRVRELPGGLPVSLDIDEPVETQCPKCGAWVVDEDGFGVLAHLGEDGCGYCSHPSRRLVRATETAAGSAGSAATSRTGDAILRTLRRAIGEEVKDGSGSQEQNGDPGHDRRRP